MKKAVKPTRPYTRSLTSEELALLDDDDIDYSDIPELTKDDFDRAIVVPVGKFEISHKFMARRDELEDLHPCVGSDGIDYGYLQPDAEFWREATLENIDEAMDRLISRRREEVRSDASSRLTHKNASSRVSA